MKKLSIIFFLLIFTRILFAPGLAIINIPSAEPIRFDPILMAFEKIESSNREKIVNSIGATGILQIMPIMIDEVNRICRKLKNPMRFTIADRLDSTKSVQIWYIVQNYYNAGYDLKRACKVWNSKAGTDYYNKIARLV